MNIPNRKEERPILQVSSNLGDAVEHRALVTLLIELQSEIISLGGLEDNEQ